MRRGSRRARDGRQPDYGRGSCDGQSQCLWPGGDGRPLRLKHNTHSVQHIVHVVVLLLFVVVVEQ